MALRAIEKVLISGQIPEIRESLTELFHEWIVSDDDPDLQQRRKMLLHYDTLQALLTDAEEIDTHQNHSP